MVSNLRDKLDISRDVPQYLVQQRQYSSVQDLFKCSPDVARREVVSGALARMLLRQTGNGWNLKWFGWELFSRQIVVEVTIIAPSTLLNRKQQRLRSATDPKTNVTSLRGSQKAFSNSF